MTPSPLSSAAHADAMREYAIERQQAATRLRARGPLDLDTDGRLAPEILRAYRTHGFTCSRTWSLLVRSANCAEPSTM